MTLKPFSCSFNSTTLWTVSGTTFSGTPDAGPLKLAAFFTGENSEITEHSILVSNVVAVTYGGAFSLDINASTLEPSDNDNIYLKMWNDDNLDDSKDSGETQYRLVPAQGDCPVFGNAQDLDTWLDLSVGNASFEWYDEGGGCILSLHDKGWNVDKGGLFTSAESVDTAKLTGARITIRVSIPIF